MKRSSVRTSWPHKAIKANLEAPLFVGPCTVVAISAINATAGAISGVLALAWVAVVVLSRR